MANLSFTLYCLPAAQQRPRHARAKNGLDVTYKSKTQRASEAELDSLLAPHAPAKPLEGAIHLAFAAVMPIPQSACKKQREAMLQGQIPHIKKPDLDKLAKQLKDAMTRLGFWHDDRQVVRLICAKGFGDPPCWKISIWQSEKSWIIPEEDFEKALRQPLS